MLFISMIQKYELNSSKSEPIFQLCTLCVRSFRWLGERTYHGGPPRPESARHVLDDWGSSYSLPRLGIFPVGTALADTYRLVQRYRLSVWDASSLLRLDTSDCNYGLDNTRSASAGLPVLRLVLFCMFGLAILLRVQSQPPSLRRPKAGRSSGWHLFSDCSAICMARLWTFCAGKPLASPRGSGSTAVR